MKLRRMTLGLVLIVAAACSSPKKELYSMIDKAFADAVERYVALADSMLVADPGRLPHSLKEDGSMTSVKPSGWTSGFFPGVKGKVDFPQIGFEKGTTERGVSKVSKSC